MSIYTSVNVTRAGVSVASNIAVQIDNLSEAIASYYQGADPYDVFDIYAPYTTFAFNRSDLLTDTMNNDPLTSAHVAYRVVNIPEVFPDGHVELRVQRMAGKQS